MGRINARALFLSIVFRRLDARLPLAVNVRGSSARYEKASIPPTHPSRTSRNRFRFLNAE